MRNPAYRNTSRPPTAKLAKSGRPLVLCIALIFAATFLGAQQRRPLEPRIPPLESSQAQLNIIRTLANHPELSDAWTPFASYILGGNSLPARDREILILRTAFIRQAEYEWGHHVRLGRQAGLSEEQIQAIAKGPNASIWSSFDRALIRAADELQRNAYISERNWAYLDARYDTKQLMDVVFTVGQYNLVSMALKTFRVQKEEGLEGFPE